MFRNYLFNGYRRIAGELIFWVIPFGIGASPSLPCPAATTLLITTLGDRLRGLFLGQESLRLAKH
jgi:hypothetical protein